MIEKPKAGRLAQGAKAFPIRVLILTSVFPRYRGDTTPAFVQNQARALAARGMQILVLAPYGLGAAWKEKTDGFEVVRFPYVWPLALSKLCYEGGMLVNFRKRPWTKLLLPFFAVAELAAALWAIRRFKPDLLHSHSLLPQGLVGALAARLSRVPHVTTAHGNDVFGLKRTGLMGVLKRAALSRAVRVTANSQATRQAVLDLGCPPSKIEVVPAAPNPPHVDKDLVENLRSQWGSDAETVLFVGRLIEEKGLGNLIEAAASLMATRPKLIVVVVGDGADRAALEAQAQATGFGDHFRFAGWAPSDEVASWMAAADVVAVPSKLGPGGWIEAQGLVAVEAMAVGAAVVASDLGGLPDMIEDGVTGYLFDSASAPALERALERALSDPRRDAIARQAKDRYETGFSPNAVAKKTEALYRSVLK